MDADELTSKILAATNSHSALGASNASRVCVVNPEGDILEVSEVTFSLVDGGMIQLHVIDPDSD